MAANEDDHEASAGIGPAHGQIQVAFATDLRPVVEGLLDLLGPDVVAQKQLELIGFIPFKLFVHRTTHV